MSAGIWSLAEGTRQKASAWLATLRDNAIPYTVTSTRRSRSEQIRLYDRFLRGESSLPAAPPGTSKHELGRALDVVFESEDDLADAVVLADQAGLDWAGMGDLVHFEDNEIPEDLDPQKIVQIASAAARARGASTFGTGIIGSVLSFFGVGDHLCCKR